MVSGDSRSFGSWDGNSASGPSIPDQVLWKDGLLWISARFAGVMVLSEAGPIAHYHSGNGLPSNDSASGPALGLTQAGEVLIGTPSGFITIRGGTWGHTILPFEKPRAAGERGTSDFLDTDSGLWVVCRSRVFHRSKAGDWYRVDPAAERLAEAAGELILFGGSGIVHRDGAAWRTVPGRVHALVGLPSGEIFYSDEKGLWRTTCSQLRSSGSGDWRHPIPFLAGLKPQVYSLYHDGRELWAVAVDSPWNQQVCRWTEAGMAPVERPVQELMEAFPRAEPSRHGCGWSAPARDLLDLHERAYALPDGWTRSFQATPHHLFVETRRGLAACTPDGWLQDDFCRSVNVAWVEAGRGRKRHHEAWRAEEVFLVAETPKGGLVACTWGLEALRVHRWGSGLETLPHRGLPQHPPTGLVAEADGGVWLSSRGGGISFWDGRRWRREVREEGLPTLDLLFLVRDPQGRLWTGDWHHQAVRRDDRWEIRSIPGMEAVDRLTFAEDRAAVQSSDGDILVLEASGIRGPRNAQAKRQNVRRWLLWKGHELCLATPGDPIEDPKKGLFQIEGESLHLVYDATRFPVRPVHLTDLAVSPDGTPWVASFQGLFELPALESIVRPGSDRTGPTGFDLERALTPDASGAEPVAAEPASQAGTLPELVRVLQEQGLVDQDVDLSDYVDEEPVLSALGVLVDQRGMEADSRDVGGTFLERILDLARTAGVSVRLLEHPALPPTWKDSYSVSLEVDGVPTEWRIPQAGQTHECVAAYLNRLLAERGAAERFHLFSPGDAYWFYLVPEGSLACLGQEIQEEIKVPE